MRALVYVRPWSVKYFEYVAPRVFGAGNYMFVGDHRGIGVDRWVDRFYAHYRALGSSRGSNSLSEAEIADVILRDRFLRCLPLDRARRLLLAMLAMVEEALNEAKPDLIFSIAIDCYLTDILERLGRQRGIPYYGIAAPFLDGYTLVTARGEINAFREPSTGEVQAVMNKLGARTYVPSYMKRYPVRTSVILKRWSREVIKVPYFLLKRLSSGDWWNYHYLSTYLLARQRSTPDKLFSGRYFAQDWEARLAGNTRPLAYLPLQLFPEMNAEYWCHNPDFLPYEAGTLRLIDAIRTSATVLVKEHPAMLGLRDSAFYKAVVARENVILLPPAVPQRELIRRTAFTLTMNSSAGIEAFFEGKPVVTTGEPYYATSRLHVNLHSLDDLGNVDEFIAGLARIAPPNERDVEAFVTSYLRTCVPCDANEIWFDAANAARVKLVDHAIEQMKVALPAWLAWSRAQPATQARSHSPDAAVASA